MIVFLLETWFGRKQLAKIRCKIKYVGLFTVPSQGRGGGLVLLWKSEVTVWVDSFSKYHIDAVVNGMTSEPWHFTGFYGESNTNYREEAWSMFRMLRSKPHLPWCCMGDFNEILRMQEKRGGRIKVHDQMQAFRDVLDECGFVNLGFIGPEFIWHSRRYGHLIWERLDRGVANYDWIAKFPTALVRHLHCFSLDHRPIKLVFDPNSMSQRWFQRPFHFKEMWLANKGCSDTVLRAWKIQQDGTSMFKVSKKLKKCKKILKSWSKDHFGSVQRQIAKAKELLWKAEEEAAKGGNYGSVIHLRRELNILLDKESRMWKQRARTQWVAKGDKNTRYFHGVATQRKRRNFIKGIKDGEEAWQTDEGVVSGIFVEFYTRLFTQSQPHDLDRVVEGVRRVVTVDTNAKLVKPYTMEEIDTTIKQIAHLKAPSLNGMLPLFYQTFWQHIGLEVLEAVLLCLNSGTLLKSINRTFITLIPKVSNLEMFQNLDLSVCAMCFIKLSAKLLPTTLNLC